MFKKLAFLLLLPFSLWAAPAITVSGNSVTILGSAQTISLTCTLIDPNNTGNLRSGSNIITTFITSTATPSNVATCGPIYGNDVITDGYGNANTTYYKVQVFTVSGGIIASTPSLQQFYAFTGSGTIDLATATPLAPSFFTGPTGNVVMPGTLTVTGAATFNGGITTTTTSSTGAGTHSGTETFTGGISSSCSGTFTNIQMNECLTNILNGLSLSTEFQATQGANFATEGIAGGIKVPSSSTVHQANGISGYTTNASTATNAVGVYGQTRALADSTNNWGANFIASDDGSRTTGVSHIGLEVDVGQQSASTAYSGLFGITSTIGGSGAVGVVGGSMAFKASGNAVNRLWDIGFSTDDARINTAAFRAGAQCTSGSCSSQILQFRSFNASVLQTATINSSSTGSLVFTPQGGGISLFNGTFQVGSGGGYTSSGTGGTIAARSDFTLTLKKGSGAGNYTNATTSYTVADSTNLCYTVTIPTGWKLGVSMSGNLGTATAAVVANYALTDNAACSTANAGILVEGTVTGTAATVLEPIALNWVITGDGAAHNIALQFKTSNGADSATLQNSSATLVPTMKFELMPSN